MRTFGVPDCNYGLTYGRQLKFRILWILLTEWEVLIALQKLMIYLM
jgi:hypothetical protein